MAITFNAFQKLVRNSAAQLPRGGAVQLNNINAGTFKLSTTDKRWAVSRSIDDRNANNDIRTLFLQEVTKELGVSTTELNRLPKAVLKALNIDDYALDAKGRANSGKPLTAYRMQQVMNAIDSSGGAQAIREENLARKEEHRAREVRAELFDGKDPAVFLNEIPENLRQFYLPAIGNVKKEADVRTAAGILNESRLAKLNGSFRTLANAMIQDLAQRRGVDFSAKAEEFLATLTGKLELKIIGACTPKIFTEDELLLDFKRTLGKLLEAKADMMDMLQANDSRLCPAARQTLTDAVMNNLSFKSADVMRTLLDHLDNYDDVFELLGKPEVTDETLVQAFRRQMVKSNGFTHSLTRLGLDAPEKGVVDVLLEQVARQNYLHSHHLEAMPPPSQQLIQVGNHFATAVGTLVERSDYDGIDDASGPYFASSKMSDNVRTVRDDVVKFLQEMGIEADFEYGAHGWSEDNPPPLPDMTRAEAECLNEFCGLGIRHEALDGEHYKQYASAVMMDKLEAELQKCVDAGEKKTSEIGKDIWYSTGKDLVRGGTGMTLNNRVLIRDLDSVESTPESIGRYAEEVHAFFMEDKAHGLQASRILSQILYQDLHHMLVTCMVEQGEIYHGGTMGDIFSTWNFQVTRQEDGSYDVAFKEIRKPKEILTGSGVMEKLQGNSIETVTLKLKLSFNKDGKARIDVTEKPLLEGELRRLDLTHEQIARLSRLKLADGTSYSEVLKAVHLEPALLENQQFRTLLDGDDDDALTAFLDAHVIREREMALLRMTGIPGNQLDALRDNVGGQPLDRALVDRLCGSAEERQAALQQLREMLQVLVQKGLITEAPVLSA